MTKVNLLNMLFILKFRVGKSVLVVWVIFFFYFYAVVNFYTCNAVTLNTVKSYTNFEDEE
jgi:hypothetical protein